jgi:hypothetical protein
LVTFPIFLASQTRYSRFAPYPAAAAPATQATIAPASNEKPTKANAMDGFPIFNNQGVNNADKLNPTSGIANGNTTIENWVTPASLKLAAVRMPL